MHPMRHHHMLIITSLWPPPHVMVPIRTLLVAWIREHWFKVQVTWPLLPLKPCKTAAADATATAGAGQRLPWAAGPVERAGLSVNCHVALRFGLRHQSQSSKRSTNLWWLTFARTPTTGCGVQSTLDRPMTLECRIILTLPRCLRTLTTTTLSSHQNLATMRCSRAWRACPSATEKPLRVAHLPSNFVPWLRWLRRVLLMSPRSRMVAC